MLKRELAKRGYASHAFKFEDKTYTRFTAPGRQTWLTASYSISYPFTTMSARLTGNFKHLSYELAESMQVAIPYTRVVNRGSVSAAECAEMLKHAPLVVKPDNATLARGVTLNIRSEESLRTAITEARAYSETVLCQSQFEGDEIRILVVDGVARGTLLRQNPQVTGDGRRTLRQLIAAENRARRKLTFRRGHYPQLDDSIITLDKSLLAVVPEAGKVVVLRHTAMIRYGASIYNISDKIHPSYLEKAEKLANALGKGLVAVDLFVKDYHTAADPKNYAFIEFNMSPILGLCYACRDSENFDIVPELARVIDRHLTPEIAVKENQNTIGSYEHVSLPSLGVRHELAKIDTGAFSGALHCTDIRIVRRGLRGKAYLKFTPLGDPRLATETNKFQRRFVRSATGHRVKRYVIDSTIEVRGKVYPIQIGLSDRSDLKRNVLIGRRFLRENNLLVDVRINQEYDDEGDNIR